MTDNGSDRHSQDDGAEFGGDRDPGQRPVVGPYRLIEILGEGGMGTVWLAEQTEPVRRRVALKIIKVGLDASDEVVARFESERQALAVMNHPSIARIYDAGADESARPYFVMELVRGTPITKYCDEHRLSTRQRIELFTQVCHAVQHAHQKGIVHRDLKPSNVLVTESEGEPRCKVIDFGIAKAMDLTGAEMARLTRTDHVVGTPPYMSPEQIDPTGVDIDTRSDIYALGVLLYELLCGALPFEDRMYAGIAGVAQALVREPPAPSVRLGNLGAEEASAAVNRGTDPRALRRELSGDLDWIVLKAMEKERDRRYETANALSMELTRYLANEPVLARPPSAVYRLRKFTRRNKASVTLAATLVVLLIGFSVNQTIQARRISNARDLADTRREQAEGLIDFMLGDLRAKLEPIGRLEILNDVGDQALAYFASLPEAEFSDEELLSRSQALYQIGEVRVGEGRLDEARRSFDESLRLAGALSRRDPENTDWLFGLGQAEFWAGYIDWRVADYDGALEHFREYMAASRELVAKDPANLDWQLELGYAHSNIGSVLEARGDLAAAAEAFRATLRVDSVLVRDAPDDPARQLDLARSYNTLAVVLTKLGALDEAAAQHEAELAIKSALATSDPSNMVWKRDLALAHQYLGNLRRLRGEREAALEHLRGALDLSIALTRQDPTNVDWRQGLAISRRHLGLLLLERGEHTGGMRELRASGEILERLHQDSPENPRWRRLLVESLQAQARGLELAGQFREALTVTERALTLLAPLLERSPDDPEVARLHADGLITRGRVLEPLGERDAAIDAWTATLDVLATLAESGAELYRQDARARTLLHLDRGGAAQDATDWLAERGYRRQELTELLERSRV